MSFFQKIKLFSKGNKDKQLFDITVNSVLRTVSVTEGKLVFSLERGEEPMFVKKLTEAQKVGFIKSFAISPHCDTKKVTLFVENSSFTKSNELEELLKELNFSGRKNR